MGIHKGYPYNRTMKNNRDRLLLYATLIAVIAAILVGGIFPRYASHTAILGDIFLNLLKMIVVPLVILSVIAGIASLGNLRNLYTIGWKTGLYFLTTTVVAAIVGVILVNFIQPGKDFAQSQTDGSQFSISGTDEGEVDQKSYQWQSTEYPDSLYLLTGEGLRTVIAPDTQLGGYSDKHLVALVDQNVVGHIESVSDGAVTVKFWAPLSKNAVYVRSQTGDPIRFVENIATDIQLKQKGRGIALKLPVVGQERVTPPNNMLYTLKAMLLGDAVSGREGIIPQNLFNALIKANILPLIFFSVFIGYALLRQGEAAEPVIDTILVINNAIMLFVDWVMYIAPLGVFGLIAGQIAQAGGFVDFLPELIAVGKYTTTVLLGLFIYGALVLPLLLWSVGGRNPLTFAKGMQPALLTAFSTGSSSSTLPITMDCVENNNGVSSQASIFVLPLGATLNMNGTGLAFAIIPMFIAQVYGITMGPLEQCLVILVATLMAISAASVPGAGWMTISIIIKTLHLPLAGIALVIPVEWLLERCETVINIWGDAVCASVIDRYQSQEFSDTLETEIDLEEPISESHVVA